jgi:ubiquinone/menaquinone biosynthesis C-methylase UbiE
MSVEQERSWELLAQHDPLQVVLSKGKLHAKWQLDEFLSTGEAEIDWAFNQANKAKILPSKINLAVDLGCGPGRLSGAIAKRANKVIGIDISTTMLTEAKRMYSNSNIQFQSSFKTIGSSSVDLVYCTFVLQHLTQFQRQRYFKEIARVLKPKGIFIFQYPISPMLTPVGIMWRIFPISFISLLQRKVQRLPAAVPMSWATPDKVSKILQPSKLKIYMYKEGLTYTKNWQDAWYFTGNGFEK